MYKDEIYQLATDGSGNVRRLAHHHSLYKSYYDSPRGVSSTDGKYITFTSNWGDTLREDVFVLKVPPYPSTPTGIGQTLRQLDDYAVYPNPVSKEGAIFIQKKSGSLSSEFVSVQLFNALGQKVADAFLTQENAPFELSVKNLPAGLYCIRLTTAKGAQTKKIIIQ